MTIGKIEAKDEAVALDFREERIWLTLRDSRIVSMPISFFSWLANATPEQRTNYELYPEVVLWPELDEGIDVYAFVTGNWIERPGLSQAGQ